jgi:hypothetical protein
MISNDEYVDMLLVYGEYNQNASKAQCVDQERYPEKRLPSATSFSKS